MAQNLAELLRLTKVDMNKFSKTQLVEILDAAKNERDNTQDIPTLIANISKLTSEVAQLTTALKTHQESTNKEVTELKQQVAKQNEVITKQQLFLEQLDRKERECNIVILGVPEGAEALDGATNDDAKVKKVWEAAGITCNVKSAKRIGNPDKRRPILVVVNSREDRDAALDKAKKLKDKEAYKRIFVKRDTHPSVRAEWTRLHEVVRREKANPDNAACDIKLDYRARKVFKDGSVIDQWSMQGF